MQASGEKATLEKLHRAIVSGSHILHYHNVLDAYGHLSVRHPSNPDVFIMSRSMAPGTISSTSDLIEYSVQDAEPIDAKASPGFVERYIHSECYKRYPGVQSVIHSHSEAVVPYTISGVPLRPCYHMAGFLGTGVPVWDIADAYRPDDIKDLLVRNTHLGNALATSFSGDPASETLPEHAVTLMRGHGFTVLAESIEDCVSRAVYTQKNALIQTTALTTRAAADTRVEIKYLDKEEAKATTEMARWSAQRPWKLWLREVEACNLYVNSA